MPETPVSPPYYHLGAVDKNSLHGGLYSLFHSFHHLIYIPLSRIATFYCFKTLVAQAVERAARLVLLGPAKNWAPQWKKIIHV